MNKLRYRTENCSLYLVSLSGEEIRVDFPYPVADVVCFGDQLIVSVEPEPGVIFNENVFAIDANGAIRWQVAKRRYVCEDSPYTGMVFESEVLKLYGWDGVSVVVDPGTGQILSERFTK